VHSLFLKIFLWFWLAMALVGAVLVIAIFFVTSGQIEEWREAATEHLAVYAPAAVETFQEEGQRGLFRYLTTLDRRSGLRTGLFDANGEEVSGKRLVPVASRLAQRALRSGTTESLITGRLALVAYPVETGAGESYAMVGLIPRRLIRGDPQPFEILLRGLVVFLTGGLVCYGLARYLASPILAMRQATREFSDGNLNARTGERVRKRGDELGDLAQDFDEMADRIQNLVESQRRLLGDISHELRSPLARLNVALGLARKQGGSSASGSSYLDRIEVETERMNLMIGELLTLSQLENRSPDIERTVLGLQEILQEVVSDAAFEAVGKNCTVEIRRCEQCRVEGSPDLLRSAIENVLRNAVRYSPADARIEVDLACRQAGNQPEAILTIRDYGPGVPEEDLGQIFQPFHRVGDARDRQSGGTGLGLAITSRAVRFHQGEVQARNAEGGGLEVEIRLPAVAGSEPATLSELTTRRR
jgi:two-component system, OmpR family, sensor histidine kinase CpxA